jgi:hypothetical protein
MNIHTYGKKVIRTHVAGTEESIELGTVATLFTIVESTSLSHSHRLTIQQFFQCHSTN